MFPHLPLLGRDAISNPWIDRPQGQEGVGQHDENTGEYILLIIQRKAPKAAEVRATTVKRWSPGEKINQKATLLIWHLPWALSF